MAVVIGHSQTKYLSEYLPGDYQVFSFPGYSVNQFLHEEVLFEVVPFFSGGVWAMTQSIACDEGRHGVRANTVSPGPISTELAEEFMATSGLEDPMALKQAFSILQRSGTVE